MANAVAKYKLYFKKVENFLKSMIERIKIT